PRHQGHQSEINTHTSIFVTRPNRSRGDAEYRPRSERLRRQRRNVSLKCPLLDDNGNHLPLASFSAFWRKADLRQVGDVAEWCRPASGCPTSVLFHIDTKSRN